MADKPPDEPPPCSSDKPPLLDYQPPEIDREPWPVVLRAMAVVFAFLVFFMFIAFGLCGGLVRGCMEMR